jgi:hypothetical protein
MLGYGLASVTQTASGASMDDERIGFQKLFPSPPGLDVPKRIHPRDEEDIRLRPILLELSKCIDRVRWSLAVDFHATDLENGFFLDRFPDHAIAVLSRGYIRA